MRNNLVFKFIAILLCAASLLGMVGSVGGILVLTEGDLYNKTVEQVRQENLEQLTRSQASALALMYSSTTLGGAPEELVEQTLVSTWFDGDYGYRILDTEGKVLSAYNENLQGTGTAFIYQPTGQYIHVVSLEAEAEAATETDSYAVEQASGITVAQALEASHGFELNPGVTIPIEEAVFLGSDGGVLFESWMDNGDAHCTWYQGDSSTGYGANDFGGPIGLLQNHNGMVGFQSTLPAAEEAYTPTEVYGMRLYGLAGDAYELYSEEPLGILAVADGSFHFTSNLYMSGQGTAEEDSSGWAVETIPGDDSRLTLIAPDGTTTEIPLPQAETVPEETAVEATVAEETLPAEAAPAAALPEEAPAETELLLATAAEEDQTLPEVTEETSAPADTVAETVAKTVAEATAETEAEAQAEENGEAAEATDPTAETLSETTAETSETIPPTQPETLPTEAPTEPLEESVPEETVPILVNGRALSDYQINTGHYWDSSPHQLMYAEYVFVPMPELTVELYVDESTMSNSAVYEVLALLRHFRNHLLPILGVSLLIFAICAVYLCTAAGRKPKNEEIRAGGLNRIPLDLYFFAAAIGIGLLCGAPYMLVNLLERDILTACGLGALAAFLACLVFVAFCFAFVAQLKTPGGFWYRNTLCGHFIRLSFRFCNWLEQFLRNQFFPLMVRSCKYAWRLCVALVLWTLHATEKALSWLFKTLGRFGHWLGHKLHRLASLLPLTWQWLITGLIIMLSTLLLTSPVFWLLGFLIPLAIIGYSSHCFGKLSESSKRMSKGDLDTKVDDKHMVGCFKDFAADLNDLAGVAVVAAQKQLKSERMKTELITNVSHDIKTPLTSIINYVDLLQKPHTPEEEAQYLEVLERQSQRLKKLIDDLMDMSKANTGNMQVDITQVDAVEAVTQALGEFADKLDRAQIYPVFRHDAVSVPMMADGRLVWRVLSNLLGNAVKYAMPGTRLYIDLMTMDTKVVISLKNISREELNVDAEELMERFVRGDDSRNTEGSGLGLNIAKSLMELQKGQLQLLVDGDLFKVTLIFPGV